MQCTNEWCTCSRTPLSFHFIFGAHGAHELLAFSDTAAHIYTKMETTGHMSTDRAMIARMTTSPDLLTRWWWPTYTFSGGGGESGRVKFRDYSTYRTQTDRRTRTNVKINLYRFRANVVFISFSFSFALPACNLSPD